ncbi:hypothetical protein [Endozoicomonas acroporae]|uniref:hypothetical protein n=1 Tax=Endozoicomonas acroporae TaxID=1701104 RepID=UPI003D7989B5
MTGKACCLSTQQTIADYIEQHCLEDDSIVLAQASMAPAVKRLPEALQHKVLTIPALCIQYLIAQLAGE